MLVDLVAAAEDCLDCLGHRHLLRSGCCCHCCWHHPGSDWDHPGWVAAASWDLHSGLAAIGDHRAGVAEIAAAGWLAVVGLVAG